VATWVVADRHVWNPVCAGRNLSDRWMLRAAGHCNCYGGNTLGRRCSFTSSKRELARRYGEVPALVRSAGIRLGMPVNC